MVSARSIFTIEAPTTGWRHVQCPAVRWLLLESVITRKRKSNDRAAIINESPVSRCTPISSLKSYFHENDLNDYLFPRLLVLQPFPIILNNTYRVLPLFLSIISFAALPPREKEGFEVSVSEKCRISHKPVDLPYTTHTTARWFKCLNPRSLECYPIEALFFLGKSRFVVY